MVMEAIETVLQVWCILASHIMHMHYVMFASGAKLGTNTDKMGLAAIVDTASSFPQRLNVVSTP